MNRFLFISPMEWATLAIALCSCVYLYFRHCYNFWKKKGIVFLKPVAPFGNYKDVILGKTSIAEFMRDIYAMFPDEPYFGVYEMMKPNLIIRDPELIKHILIKDFASFPNRVFEVHEDIDPMSVNLFNIQFPRWQAVRNKWSPAFTTGKLKVMFGTVSDCAELLKQEFDSNTDVPLNVAYMFSAFLTDVVGSCAFGMQLNAIKDENSEFRKMTKKIMIPTFLDSMKRLIGTVFPSAMRLFRIKITPGHAVADFFVGVLKDVLQYREEHNVVRNDFVDLLIQMKKQGSFTVNNMETNQPMNVEFTDTLLTAQAFIFLLAGSETSSITLSCCLYELALNLDLQDKLRQSVNKVLNEFEGKLSYESVFSMPYMDQVIDETLRKYPPASFIMRECTRQYRIPGTSHTLEPGQMVFIPALGLHYDSQYFPEPDVFNPENFSHEAIASRPKNAYLPFGTGPRNCVGLRFAFLTMKCALSLLLTNFEFKVCEKTKIPMELDPRGFVLTPKGGLWLKVEKLKPA